MACSLASLDRQIEWSQCCAKAMGYEWISEDEKQHEAYLATVRSTDVIQITNLLPESILQFNNDEEKEEEGKNNTPKKRNRSSRDDAWMESAICIEQEIQSMSNWIRKKKNSYISVDCMTNEVASIIQSTVTTFAATTASEIETLRQMAEQQTDNNNNENSQVVNDMNNHRSGIVQILLSRLKEEIAETFSSLQKQRSREALRIWQDPLHCKLLIKQKDQNKKKSLSINKDKINIDQVLGLDDDDDDYEKTTNKQRFFPTQDDTGNRAQVDFLSSYTRDENLTINPQLLHTKSMLCSPRLQEQRQQQQENQGDKSEIETGREDERPIKKKLLSPTAVQESDSLLKLKMPKRNESGSDMPYQKQQQQYPQGFEDDDYGHYSGAQVPVEELEREAVLLTAIMHGDLDSVQKMEQRMVEITTLISQFSDLVSEQKEDIYQIHDATVATKENIEKGQNSLVDAAERTKTSGHYTAKATMGMAILLLLFNFLRA